MKVVWFSNSILTKGSSKTSGTWLYSMANSLVGRDIDLFNITQSNVNDVDVRKDHGITEYVLPTYSLNNGLPNKTNLKKILDIVDEISPDIIQIWGTELYFGLLAARDFLKEPVILEIQGFKASCAPVFYGGLGPMEILQCIGVREILKPSLSLLIKKRLYEKWGKFEIEMLQNAKHISTQSEWVRGWINVNGNSNAKIYNTLISVRNAFVCARKWERKERENPIVMVMSAGSEAYKGVHIAIKAIALLKKKYPGIQLHIAGYYGADNSFYRKPGYTKFLQKQISKLGLNKNVSFVGQLAANEIADEMSNADCFLQTSFVESYSLALAEAMMIGVPCVATYAGAMPELAISEEEALFYAPADFVNCAYQVGRIIDNMELAMKLSKNSIATAEKRNTGDAASQKQLDIYEKVVNG